jgi:DNA (cytosine-5)-methyltransferase 1
MAFLNERGNLVNQIRFRGGHVATALDLFCGAGGGSAGARAAGFDVIAAIDMCPIATQTFKANFPSSQVFTERLEGLHPGNLGRRLGKIDLLLASPECTNHTCARGSAPRDEQSRATAMQVVRYASALLPRWLVLENVIHMRPWSRYAELKEKIRRLGYSVTEQILDASDFGVAQTRRRLFIVGDRERPPTVVTEKRRGRRRAAKSILDPPGTWDTTPLVAPTRAPSTLERARRAFAALGDHATFLLVYYGTEGSGGWQPLGRPLRTITTIDRFALIQPCRNNPRIRMLQVPELKRAMGFSDSFALPTGTRRERVRLLGNAVCPPVMEAVVRALTKHG